MYNNKEIENELLSDDQSRIIISCGVKQSSKTFNLLSYLHCCFIMKRYKHYHLVLPNFGHEADDDQYKFMNNYSKDNKISIYNKYSPLVIKKVVGKQNREPTLFVIDDATSQGGDISNSHAFQRLLTESRHLNITVYIIVHSLKKVLSPLLRANCDYLMLFRVTNINLLKTFYEEMLGLYPCFKNFNDFKNQYFEKILNIKYNGMFLNLLNLKLTMDIKGFNMNNCDYSIYDSIKEVKKELKVISVDPEKDKLLEILEKKKVKFELENKLSKV